jgi:hypothetical protein
MITIENRSAFFVTVPKHRNLDQTLAYHRKKEFEAYVAELKAAKHEPVLSRGDSNYAVRVRALGHRANASRPGPIRKLSTLKTNWTWSTAKVCSPTMPKVGASRWATC